MTATLDSADKLRFQVSHQQLNTPQWLQTQYQSITNSHTAMKTIGKRRSNKSNQGPNWQERNFLHHYGQSGQNVCVKYNI